MRDAHSNKLELPVLTVQDFSDTNVDTEINYSTTNCGKLIHDCDTDDSTHLSHFDQLKFTTERLNLETRRPSYVAWREQYLGKPLCIKTRPATIHESVFDNGEFTETRKNKIEENLSWLKQELMEMRSEDKLLACKLLSLRKDIQHLKLQKGHREHEELLDDAQADYEEFTQISELCDMPLEDFRLNNNPLKHLGVTRLNLNARRFSTC